MAVGDVMHELADGPAAFAIGRVELGVEACERRLQTLGEQLAGFQSGRTEAGSDEAGGVKRPMG